MYLLLGYGKSNQSIEKYLINNNIKYVIYDDNIKNEEINLGNINLIIKSNGIMLTHPIILEAVKFNIKIISDLQYYYNITRKNNSCLVTGSNGKTTIVSMIEKCMKNTIAIGNNGLPFFDYINNDEYKILEVSSFMLESSKYLNYKYNIITNIYPTHLEHHINYINYIKAKLFFMKYLNKSNYIIYVKDDVLISKFMECYECNKISVSLYDYSSTIYLKDNYIYYLKNKILDITKIKLLGDHNIYNIMLVLGFILNNKELLNDNYKQIIYNFTGIKYRMDIVYDKDFRIINDSKSTNFKALSVALSSIEKDIILILGGKIREDNYDLISKYNNRINKVYCYGENKEEFFNYFYNNKILCYKFNNLKEVVDELIVNKKETLLFSPGSVSYDQFKDFEERGSYFNKLIKTKYNFK